MFCLQFDNFPFSVTFCTQKCWQIYVEIERARLIKKLAKIKEEQGLVAEAADLMQEVAVSLLFIPDALVVAGFIRLCQFSNRVVPQVETFGAMAKTEKIAFILEQVRG